MTIESREETIQRKDAVIKKQGSTESGKLEKKSRDLPFMASKGDSVIWTTQYLDENAFRQERKTFDEMVDSVMEQADKSLPILYDPIYSRYKKLIQEHSEGVIVVNLINDRSVESKTFSELTELNVLRIGVMFLMHDNLQRRIKILEQHSRGSIAPSQRLLKLLDFDIAEAVLKIGSVSLRDFIEEEKKWKKSPAPFLDFLIKSGVMGKRDDDYGQISKDNKGEFEDLFPNLLQQHGRHLVRTVVCAAQASPGLLIRIGNNLPDMGKKGAKVAVKLVENVREFQELVYKNVVNPYLTTSEEIIQVIEQYINGEEDEKIYALLSLGLVDIKRTRALYRSLFRSVGEGRASNAQKSLLFALDILISKYPSTENLPTYEDVQSIFDQTMSIDEAIPAINDIGKKVGAIFSISSEKNYSFDSEEIPWIDALALPQNMKVTFGDRPKKFTVELDYENEIGEKINVDMQIDCEKQTFDWTFLESPDDKRMEKLRDVLLITVGSIIDVIQKKTELEFEEKRKAGASQLVVATRPSVAKKNHEREIQAVEERAQKTPAVITPIMRALQEVQDSKAVGMPKNHIILPPDDVLNGLLKEIGAYDHEKVLGAIDRYNMQGGAGFSQLDTRGEPRYELKIGSKGVPKGIRVILVPSVKESLERGVRQFEVYGIWYRGESFKRHRRKKLDSNQ